MPRPKKTKIDLNKESLVGLMQEIYNNCTALENKAKRELIERKNSIDIDGVNEAYQMGKVNNESLKILESAIDKKLALAKLQSQVTSNIEKTTEDGDGGQLSGGLSDEDKEMLKDMFKQNAENNNIEYDID